MSFELKTILQPDTVSSPQQKKLYRLIEKIEQQKLELAKWQQAKDEVLQYTRKHLIPVYKELHKILFDQLQQLWEHLSHGDFSKADALLLDHKIQSLAQYLKSSQSLSSEQLNKVDELHQYYQQSLEHHKSKKKKASADRTNIVDLNTQNDHEAFVENEDWDQEQYQQLREQARLQRQHDKKQQAEKMAEQSLKTVYLKIASTIHPDREPDEAKKLEKTEIFQHVNAAYEQQDLFYLLKLQIQIEQDNGSNKKGLGDEQLKFYKMALDSQSQKLADQLAELIDALVWSEKAKIKVQKAQGKLQISDLYAQIDEDTSALKQQLKWEKERLKYMGKVKGMEMLLGNGVL
ncbi:molecular chaperone DnaJ [Acinetobacter sp. WCHAc010052]|uniref:molecular chaperone DnaJ n=1 Tax=Acinetobacter sp. WCHAc010052 TaxID=2004647 RepID=UPI000B3D1F38|nr:molecular chaperone DnaJ [Acinetobacter sp. WCHAc010052]AXY59403.1 molecular chaperone DnaJ [Acinetobacter sp. WCHAc010052]